MFNLIHLNELTFRTFDQGSPDELIYLACADDQYKCGSGECIPKNRLCDGYDDCIDISDELNCAGTYQLLTIDFTHY